MEITASPTPRMPYVWLGLLALLIFRIFYAWLLPLAPDEAVYWAWSRHLALGYFDHPPMVAWLIWLSTQLFGSTELGARFLGIILTLSACAILIALAQRLCNDTRATLFIDAIWLLSPLPNVLAAVITPDTPTFFFLTASLACVLLAISPSPGTPGEGRVGALRESNGRARALLWLSAGLLTGLALLSKYTAVLLPFAILLAFLTSRDGRRQLASPWPYLAGLLAIAIFSPVILWNRRHDFASFRFQLHHGTGLQEGSAILRVLEYIAGQLLVFTPVLFTIAVFVLGLFWLRVIRRRPTTLAERTLLFSATVPLLFFAYASSRARGEINWPAFAYVPASLLLMKFLAEKWDGERAKWTRLGITVALVASIGMHLPWLLFKLGIRPAQMVQMFDTPAIGRLINDRANGLPVICNRHQYAGIASFYMHGQPDVWADSSGSRPTAWDYFDNPPPLPDRLLFVGDHVEEFCARHGFAVVQDGRYDLPSLSPKKKRTIRMAELARAIPAPKPVN